MYISDEDLKKFIKSELGGKEIKLHSYFTM